MKGPFRENREGGYPDGVTDRDIDRLCISSDEEGYDDEEEENAEDIQG